MSKEINLDCSDKLPLPPSQHHNPPLPPSPRNPDDHDCCQATRKRKKTLVWKACILNSWTKQPFIAWDLVSWFSYWWYQRKTQCIMLHSAVMIEFIPVTENRKNIWVSTIKKIAGCRMIIHEKEIKINTETCTCQANTVV